MPEFHEDVHARGQQTIAIWITFDPAFTVGPLTLAQHTADVAAIITAVTARDAQQDAVDDARSAREANFNFLGDLGVRAPRAIEGQLAADDDLHGEISDVRAIESTSQDNAQARVRRVISLWTRVNVKRAAAVPPLPALLVGATAVGDLQTALDNHPGLLQTVENEKSELNQKRADLRSATNKVDKNNKRWYAAWEGNFAEGSAERAALSQIDTGPQTPAPSALEIAGAGPLANGDVLVSYVAGGGNHATTLTLQWLVEGVDADFGHDTPVVVTGQGVSTNATSGQTVRLRTLAVNSTGETLSAEATAVIP